MMGLDPNLFTIKVESMILAKGLSFLFQRIGCLFLAEIMTVVFLDELPNMMVNSGGADSSASEGTSGTKPPILATPASSKNSSLGTAPPLVHHMLPGDGSGASSSNPRANLNLSPREEVEVPELDLNMIPSPSPEPSPPAELEPSPDHLNQLLLAKKIELKNELASLIQRDRLRKSRSWRGQEFLLLSLS
ncbi:hypothetical protein CsSME_00047132 [Camellia sinensis var. sinensis]